MTDFYAEGTASATTGDTRVTSEGDAIWIAANIKKGDVFQTAEIAPLLIATEPVYDADNDNYYFDLALPYPAAGGAGLLYSILKTSSEWGTNRTLAAETAALIQAFTAGALTEDQLNAAVAAAEAAQTAAEAAFDAFDDVYLGAKAADPASDNDGNALVDGQIYFNTVSGKLRIRASVAWGDMLAGQQGAQGVGAGIQYTAMTSTTDADPGGPGNMRWNNTDHTAATKLWLDDTDVNNVSMAAAIMAWGGSSSSVKGQLFVWNKTNRAIFRLYNVTAAPTDKTGYREVTVSYVSSAGVLPNTTAVELVFIPKGDKGDTGAAGQSVGNPFAFSTTTADADPGNGALRANNATFLSITSLYVDNQDNNAKSMTGWLDSLDDVTNANARGYLRLQSPTDPTIFMEFAVTGAVVDGGGYRKVPVSPIAGAVPVNGTVLVATFAPAGKDGAAGSDGADPGVLMNFDTATADANPTAGFFRANNATFSAATKLYVSKTSRAGVDISAYLATFDDSSNPTVKGTVVLTRPSDEAQAIYQVTALTDATGYVKLDVTYKSGAVFANNDPISLEFYATGDRGSSGAGTGDVGGPSSSTANHLALFSDTTGKAIDDAGVAVADLVRTANNGSDFASQQAVFDNISKRGANVASAATVDLDAVTGSLIRITGTVATSAITLSDGRYRRLVAAAAWPLTATANLVLNNGGSSYTCAAGDQLDVYAEGTTIRVSIIPISGSSPGAQPHDADLDTWATLSPSANAQSLVTAANYAAMRTLLGLALGTDIYSKSAVDSGFQALNSLLTAVAGLGSNGLMARTSSSAAAARSIAVSTGLTVSNGDGVSGNPTIGVDFGKQTIWVPAGAMKPRTTNGCASLATVELTTNKNLILSLDFDGATQEFAQFRIRMPKSWNEGTVTFIPVWSHAATATNFGVVWGLDAVAVSDGDDQDVAFGTAQTSTDTGGTTNREYHGPESSAITIAGTPAAGDEVMFRIHRDPANASDTMTIDARLQGIVLLYTIDTLKDD